MDLALALGMTVADLDERMTETEFGLWAQYAAYKGLPARRAEYHAAQGAWATLEAAGRLKQGASWLSFLIDPAPVAVAAANDDDGDEFDAFDDLPTDGVRPPDDRITEVFA